MCVCVEYGDYSQWTPGHGPRYTEPEFRPACDAAEKKCGFSTEQVNRKEAALVGTATASWVVIVMTAAAVILAWYELLTRKLVKVQEQYTEVELTGGSTKELVSHPDDFDGDEM
jgi:hypothetical protein